MRTLACLLLIQLPLAAFAPLARAQTSSAASAPASRAALAPYAGELAAELPIARADAQLGVPGAPPLEVRVHYPSAPAADAKLPVIVFSHGLGGSKETYAYLGEFWARHGYVSIHVTHPGSDTSLVQGKRLADVAEAFQHATRDPEILKSRPRQIGQVLDALPELEQRVPALAGHLDAARVGVAGHSYGAYTTMAVAGQKVRLPGVENGDLSDARPHAFIALSPQGPNPLQSESSYAAVRRPLLVMTGSLDEQPKFLVKGAAEQGGEWRAQVFGLLPPGDKWLVYLEGARHSTFSGGAGAAIKGEQAPDPQMLRCIESSTLAFWDAYLRELPAARAYLDANGPRAAFGALVSRCEHR